jgi:hypothetical protein
MTKRIMEVPIKAEVISCPSCDLEFVVYGVVSRSVLVAQAANGKCFCFYCGYRFNPDKEKPDEGVS